ncbi:MAG: class I SAM-dependent methyltransferase [Alphaproteobacteria bacterium]|nr:class I SAM-dependent methyltransferase [Alphaproteobacteria bacterium]
MNCRHCSAPLEHVVVDLGHQPPSNAYLDQAGLMAPEVYAPLKAYVCDTCWLVQLVSSHVAGDLFTPDYAYFSSVSSSWVAHARSYVENAIDRFQLGPESFVVEIASNDGYLLQFVKEAGIPCLGIEPTASTAAAARARGIESLEVFFGKEQGAALAAERRTADLIVANNVLAHVPDINGFVAGFKELLSPDGVATFEFPHVMQLVDNCQFDTIYHEHFSYLSLTAVQTILDVQGLRIFDVEEISTHGGSLRVFACLQQSQAHQDTSRVGAMVEGERAAGLLSAAYYTGLQSKANTIKLELLEFLVSERQKGRVVAAYGAAAKGNTLLNYAGVKPDLISFVCDEAPSKQGRYMPGSHIPILAPEALDERRPDSILILPWNLEREIASSIKMNHGWTGTLAVAIPELRTL